MTTLHLVRESGMLRSNLSLLQHQARDLILGRLTSNCDLDSDIDENVKRHEVDHFEAQYLLVSALLVL